MAAPSVLRRALLAADRRDLTLRVDKVLKGRRWAAHPEADGLVDEVVLALGRRNASESESWPRAVRRPPWWSPKWVGLARGRHGVHQAGAPRSPVGCPGS